MDIVKSLTQKLLAVKDPSSLSVRQRLINYGLPLPNDQIREALKVLQLIPWFFRLWTLQEVVLSKEAVSLCGRKSTSWEMQELFGTSGTAARTPQTRESGHNGNECFGPSKPLLPLLAKVIADRF